MMTYICEYFLDDVAEYRRAEAYWNEVWDGIELLPRVMFDWITPWLGTGSPALLDGNPIFSAHSLKLRKGIRIIQHRPARDGRELEFWLDTYGGDVTDPESIRELVIACALSDVTVFEARLLMNEWVRTDASSITLSTLSTRDPSLRLGQRHRTRSYTIVTAA
jgi:hypothetical protein